MTKWAKLDEDDDDVDGDDDGDGSHDGTEDHGDDDDIVEGLCIGDIDSAVLCS